ncbi:MAG: HD domain-containing protein [Lachnospiraceae bacterium]|nr:HD domain-containing protein [Lachnospiraceae bacterium]
MLDLPRVLLAVSLVLTIINIIIGFWYIQIRRDVTIVRTKGSVILSIVILLIMVSLSIAYIILLAEGISNIKIARGAIGYSILMILFSTWAFLHMEALKQRAMEILETIISILEVENSNLDGHSLHVHNLTMLLYDYLPYRMKWKINPVNLSYASLLIDLGKLGVPARVLNKTGKLLSDEWALMKRHPEISARIFEPIRDFDAIRDWILYHHERMDGNGYYRKNGEEIPLAARLITVADTYSSITMVRSFKPTLSYADAIIELILAAGSQLDPEIVEYFCRIPKNQVDACFEDVRSRMARFEAEGFRREQETGD